MKRAHHPNPLSAEEGDQPLPDRSPICVHVRATYDPEADSTWRTPRSIVILYVVTVAFSAAFGSYLRYEIEQPSSSPGFTGRQ